MKSPQITAMDGFNRCQFLNESWDFHEAAEVCCVSAHQPGRHRQDVEWRSSGVLGRSHVCYWKVSVVHGEVGLIGCCCLALFISIVLKHLGFERVYKLGRQDDSQDLRVSCHWLFSGRWISLSCLVQVHNGAHMCVDAVSSHKFTILVVLDLCKVLQSGVPDR